MATSTKTLKKPRPASRRTSSLSIAPKFSRLVAAWRHDTALQSSVTAIAMHPAYQQMIGLGERALPLIFQELRRETDHWFWALQAITGENPIPEDHAGDLDSMRNDWLSWADAHHYSQ